MASYGVDLVTYSLLILYLIDIGFEFLTAYYNHGNLVVNKKKIALFYLKSYFAYDLIAVLINSFFTSLGPGLWN